MTPTEIKALTVGSSVNDGTGALGTVTFTRDRSSLVEIDGVLEIKWTSTPHTNRISVFNYRDPIFRRFTPGVVTKTDSCVWGSWSLGYGYVGATSLTAVTTNDTIYVSLNGIGNVPWTNLQWTNLRTGDKIKLWNGAAIVWQYWTCTATCINTGARFQVPVTGTLLVIPPGGTIICTHEYFH